MRDASGSEFKRDYHRYIVLKVLFIIGLLASILLISGVALSLGGRDISVTEVFRILWHHITGYVPEYHSEEWYDDYAVYNVRLPRILVGIIAGAGLAIGGGAMQPTVRNPLADPYTTGISSGACFGVALAIALGFSVHSHNNLGLVINAFIFGLVPAALVIVMSRFRNTSPATIILTGVALSFLFNALSVIILVGSDAEKIQAAYLWQIGTLENVNWDVIPVMLTVTLIGAGALIALSPKINIMTLGDSSSRSLGLDANTFRIIILVILSVMTASIVGYIGIIGFIGLVSPHIVRLILGSDNRYAIPASALFGAAFLLFADLLARLIIYPGELAVGVVMAFIGAPIFLFLIIRNRREIW